MQSSLADLAAGVTPTLLPMRDPELDKFLKSLPTAWQKGDARPTHRISPKPPRNWRTRADPFEAVWPVICSWLKNEPDRTAKELFHRLQVNQPNIFPDGQLRTLQRRIQEWRTKEAINLLLSTTEIDGLQVSESANTLR